MRVVWRSALIAACLIAVASAHSQMVTGADMPGYSTTFGLESGRKCASLEVREIAVTCGKSVGANVLWPGETARFRFRFTNKTAQPIHAAGRIEVIRYGTSVPVGDVWTPHVFRISTHGSTPLSFNVPANGSAEVEVSPPIPPLFGGYALVADLGDAGRAFCATLVRVPRADPGRVQFPTYALDLPWPHEMSEAVAALFERLGVKGCRLGAGYYPTTAPDFAARHRQFIEHLGWAWKHNITAMLTVGEGGAPMPLGRPRPWLSPDGVMLDTKSDCAWLPEYDADFRKWVAHFASACGWPKGPINAFELWNEPWEGISISGWGADMLRFREMFTQMALGVEDARRDAGVKVLIGGACSSTNTRDKLFCDGSDRFLKWLDFVSIHYQPLAADPAVDKQWVARKGPYGPVRVWDTESWVANAEDRVAGVIASMRAQGQTRTAGIYHGNVYTPEVLSDHPRMGIAQAWAPAAAVAASQKFIGQRRFREILFRNGLPWVFVFDGLTGVDDGTLVVVGDLGQVYDRNRVKWRGVTGLANAAAVAKARRALESPTATASDEERRKAQDALSAAMVVRGAELTVANPGSFVLHDFYGNPVRAHTSKLTVPLNGLGYFLRTDGRRGSFVRLVAAVRAARVQGYTPVSITARDLVAPVEQQPKLVVALTNILNRPIKATVRAKIAGLDLTHGGTAGPVRLALAPHASMELTYRVSGQPAATNSYRLSVAVDAGPDGSAEHQEEIHVNWIARRPINIDGDLADWKGVLPLTIGAAGAIGTSLTEKAYLPFLPFEPGSATGLATGYTSYDDRAFYFAAKVLDTTPTEGGVRFETRDDDHYFYPAKSVGRDGAELIWPAGVRRFSYRMDPDLPSGNGTDSVQIAFNVLRASAKPWLCNPPGTMPGYQSYWDTDYEFGLNAVASENGGGAEIWRLQAPGIPRKHFYPRQPTAPNDGGPIKSGKLVMRREGATRIVEVAIPWRVIPEVRARMLAGQPIKFTFRVNDNKGPALELAAGRSVAREGNPTFHNDWASHWANELEFGWER